MTTTQPFRWWLAVTIAMATLACCTPSALAQNRAGAVKRGAARQPQRPNILVIMSDDVGITNLSAYSRGLVGYQTPNIDRIAREGMIFTDSTPSRVARRGDPRL